LINRIQNAAGVGGADAPSRERPERPVTEVSGSKRLIAKA
jgi:hypothetical protein